MIICKCRGKLGRMNPPQASCLSWCSDLPIVWTHHCPLRLEATLATDRVQLLSRSRALVWSGVPFWFGSWRKSAMRRVVHLVNWSFLMEIQRSALYFLEAFHWSFSVSKKIDEQSQNQAFALLSQQECGRRSVFSSRCAWSNINLNSIGSSTCKLTSYHSSLSWRIRYP